MEHMDRPLSLAGGVDATASEHIETERPTFEELFANEHEKLYRALYLIVGNGHDAEELVQEAFMHVFERWEKIANPAGYLYRSALNASRSRFRRLTLAAKRTFTPREAEDPMALADLRDEVARALSALPERQRAALVLVDLLDYRSEDAAGILGITPATVRSLASHGRASLKRSMEADDDR
jgi:RNA polymerase sigma-70 factor, ECF subfamily